MSLSQESMLSRNRSSVLPLLLLKLLLCMSCLRTGGGGGGGTSGCRLGLRAGGAPGTPGRVPSPSQGSRVA